MATKRLPPEEAHKLTSTKGVGNAFQNIDRARQKYEPLEIDPFEALEADVVAYLRLNIEKRHVLGHNLGLADEKYAEVALREQPGQTVVLLAGEVSRFADAAASVVTALEHRAFNSN